MFISRIIRLLRFFLGLFLKPLIIFCYKLYYGKVDKTIPLPKIKSPLLLLPAAKLAKKIRNKEVQLNEFITLILLQIKNFKINSKGFQLRGSSSIYKQNKNSSATS